MNPSLLLSLCAALLLKRADSEQGLKEFEIWAGTWWARDLPGLNWGTGIHLTSSQAMQSHSASWGKMDRHPGESISHHFSSFFFFFQGPIGLDGKPVSKEVLCRLPALPPARSHCAASLPYTVCLKGIILQCHAHVWIKRKLGGWQAGGCHRCLEGDAGVRRLRKAEHGLFLSR